MSLSLEIERVIRRPELSSCHFQFSTFYARKFHDDFPRKELKVQS